MLAEVEAETQSNNFLEVKAEVQSQDWLKITPKEIVDAPDNTHAEKEFETLSKHWAYSRLRQQVDDLA